MLGKSQNVRWQLKNPTESSDKFDTFQKIGSTCLLEKRKSSVCLYLQNDCMSPPLQLLPQPLPSFIFSLISYSVIPFILVIYFRVPKQCIVYNHITTLNTDCLISTPLSSLALSVPCMCPLQISVIFPLKKKIILGKFHTGQ